MKIFEYGVRVSGRKLDFSKVDPEKARGDFWRSVLIELGGSSMPDPVRLAEGIESSRGLERLIRKEVKKGKISEDAKQVIGRYIVGYLVRHGKFPNLPVEKCIREVLWSMPWEKVNEMYNNGEISDNIAEIIVEEFAGYASSRKEDFIKDERLLVMGNSLREIADDIEKIDKEGRYENKVRSLRKLERKILYKILPSLRREIVLLRNPYSFVISVIKKSKEIPGAVIEASERNKLFAYELLESLKSVDKESRYEIANMLLEKLGKKEFIKSVSIAFGERIIENPKKLSSYVKEVYGIEVKEDEVSQVLNKFYEPVIKVKEMFKDMKPKEVINKFDEVIRYVKSNLPWTTFETIWIYFYFFVNVFLL